MVPHTGTLVRITLQSQPGITLALVIECRGAPLYYNTVHQAHSLHIIHIIHPFFICLHLHVRSTRILSVYLTADNTPLLKILSTLCSCQDSLCLVLSWNSFQAFNLRIPWVRGSHVSYPSPYPLHRTRTSSAVSVRRHSLMRSTV